MLISVKAEQEKLYTKSGRLGDPERPRLVVSSIYREGTGELPRLHLAQEEEPKSSRLAQLDQLWHKG